MFTSYIKINDLNLFYKVYGSSLEEIKKVDPNKISLIFLHGGPGVVDHTLYEEYWSQFSNINGLQVIFIDHRGNGKSYIDNEGKPDYGDPDKWNLKQWGTDVYDFFTALKINKPIIAGVSFGGVVAMSCATQFPTALGGLILCDTDAQFDLDEVINQFAKRVKEAGKDDEAVTEVLNIVKEVFLNPRPEIYNQYLQKCMPYCANKPYLSEKINKCIKNLEVAAKYNNSELTKYNFLPLLKNISCPVLVLAGDLNPVHNAHSAIRTSLALNPDLLTFKLYENTGSPVYADKSAEVKKVIMNFCFRIISKGGKL